MTSPASAPLRQHAAGVRPLLTALAMCALFLAAMDSTAIGTLLPIIKGEFADAAQYPWLMSGFILASVIATPLAGRLSDIVGEKRTMMAALAVFLGSSGLTAWVSSMDGLIFARALQGAGAGAVTVTTYVIVGRLYDSHERGKVQGLLSLVWGLAAIAGPLIGALIQERYGWRMVFLLNVPLCAVIIGLIAMCYPALHTAGKGNPGALLDVPAQLSFATLLGSALILVMAPTLQLGDLARAFWAVVMAASFLLQVYRIRSNARHSVLPMPFVAERRYIVPALLTLLASASLYASVTLLPLYFIGAGRASTVGGGVLVMMAALGWVAGSAVCGGVLSKIGFRVPAVLGGAMLLGGSAMLWAMPATADYWLFGLAQALTGLGIGFAATSTLVLVQNQAPRTDIGSYTAAIQLCRNVGAVLGINATAALQIVALRNLEMNHSVDAWTQSFGRSFLLLLALTFAALLCSLLMPGRASSGNQPG
jgi:MFS family permease